MLTFAIGDIHGCSRLLEQLVAKCADLGNGRKSKYVFLGDYIDRGPDSRGAIDFLIRFQSIDPDRTICLCGNHEDFLLRNYSPDDLTLWIDNGGASTLESYSVNSPGELPASHINWLRDLPAYHDDGKRFFVHAGISPERPLNSQRRDDLLWIREPFLSSTKQYERLIVHGHTPTAGNLPDLKANRLSVDTGAVFGGPLTAAVFDDSRLEPVTFVKADGVP